MPKHARQQPDDQRAEGHSEGRGQNWMLLVSILVAAALTAALVFFQRQNRAASNASVNPGSNSPAKPTPAATPEPAAMGVAQAVMVTVDLDFGATPPSIAEALAHIERRHEPQDGAGRTFSVIDAFGEPTPEGKLRVSMHVSTEKPGVGSLVFKRTGETLWRSRITAGTNSPVAKPLSLTVLVDNLQGKTWMVDGSNNPATLLAANLRDTGVSVGSAWPDGAEMEISFIYSACGCPVKVRVRRVGDKMIRTKELPVIFPDDPAVVRVIEKLMGW